MDTTKDVYTGLSDKADAMEYAISHVRDTLKKDVRSAVWIKEDKNGHHVFEVSYTTVLQSFIPKKVIKK